VTPDLFHGILVGGVLGFAVREWLVPHVVDAYVDWMRGRRPRTDVR
jgi:hypothetical protein